VLTYAAAAVVAGVLLTFVVAWAAPLLSLGLLGAAAAVARRDPPIG
jgi:hypothetical protein